MRMTKTLETQVNKANSLQDYKHAILAICNEYMKQHPRRTGFFSMSSHTNQALAIKLRKEASNFEMQEHDNTKLDYEEAILLIDKVKTESGSGSLNKCLYKATDAFLNSNYTLADEYQKYQVDKLVTNLESVGFI